MKFKNIILTIFLILFISTFYHSVAVTELNDTISNITNELKQQNANILSELSSLKTSVATIPNAEAQQKMLEAHLMVMQQINESFRNQLLTNLILVGLAFIGLTFSGFLLLKARRKI